MVQDFDMRGHVKAVLLISFVLKLAKNPNAMPYNVLPIPFLSFILFFFFGLPILRTLISRQIAAKSRTYVCHIEFKQIHTDHAIHQPSMVDKDRRVAFSKQIPDSRL